MRLVRSVHNTAAHRVRQGVGCATKNTKRLGHNLSSLRVLHPVESIVYDRQKLGNVTHYTFHSPAAVGWIEKCYEDLQALDNRL
jgi:hypothetical protein